MKSFYLRNDVLEALAFQATNRELALYWGKDRTIRGLKAESVEEFRSIINCYNTDRPFSILRSVESFSDPLELSIKPPSSLRIEWDFIVDIDAEEFELSRRAAYKLMRLYEVFNLPYLMKFSGRRGFHFITPGKVFDVGTQKEWLDAYPELPKKIAEFLNACLNELKVKLDFSIYKPRHMIRMAYSIHQESGLASIPLDNPVRFKLEDAKPENLKASIDYLRLDYEPGCGLELLKAVSNWLEDTYVEPAVKVLSYGCKHEGEGSYKWIETLMEHSVDDGRHRLLWLIVAPYLVNVKGFSVEEAAEEARAYLQACSKLKPISGDLERLCRYYVEYAKRKQLKPLSLRTLQTKPEYADLWNIVEKALKGSKYENDGGSSKRKETLKYTDFEIAGNFDDPSLKGYPLIAVKMVKRELEYKIEASTLEEAKAIVKQLLPRFRKYPTTEHWEEEDERNMLLGWLAEKIFDMTVNQFKIQHVWNHPIIQDFELKRGKSTEPDFIVGNFKIDVKATSSKDRPGCYYVNVERFKQHHADIYVFIRFNEKLTHAWISGYLKREDVEKMTVEKLKYGEAFKIPIEQLNPITTLFRDLGGEMPQKYYGKA